MTITPKCAVETVINLNPAIEPPIAGVKGEMKERRIEINRAPVLTLWAAVVAQRVGFEWDEALSLGKAVSGLTAQNKGRHLGKIGRAHV